MNNAVCVVRKGSIAVIEVHNPPVNALSHPVRVGLLEAIEQVENDPAVEAIVLHGVGRAFMAGADIRELEDPPREPLLKDVLMRIESCPRPVIAALHGFVLGGGAEAALASHYRCAAPDLKLGFPEVTLGLLPGAGGTVRLPRLAGVQTALELMTGGRSIGRERAQALGMIDSLIDGDIRQGALDYARTIISRRAGPRRTRDRNVPDASVATESFFREYRATAPRGAGRAIATQGIIRSTQAAVDQPFEVALNLAQALFQECRISAESRALRYLFLAERGRKATGEAARLLDSIGVVGAGTMGSGIAATFAQSGFDVTLVDSHGEALQAGLTRIESILESAVKRGRLTSAEIHQVRSRIHGATDLAVLSSADLVVEAVFEDLAVKQHLFERLGRIAKPGSVLATNTSALDVNVIGSSSGRPPDVVGMHFFSPADLMRLVEIVRTQQSSPQAIGTAVIAAQRLGKLAIVVGNAFGFVGNRMLYAYGREKELMLLEGAAPEQIDHALEQFGMSMGPNAVGDLSGLDVGVHARRQWPDRPSDPRFYRVSELLVEHGRLGQKCGRGFYRYEGSQRQRHTDPEVLALIREEAIRLGVSQRVIANTEIVDRCVLALINEGAYILQEGIAQSAADIDLIWCNGYGFPRARGGPMFYADTVGLPHVLDALQRYRRIHDERYWRPAPLLEQLSSTGKRFSDGIGN